MSFVDARHRLWERGARGSIKRAIPFLATMPIEKSLPRTAMITALYVIPPRLLNTANLENEQQTPGWSKGQPPYRPKCRAPAAAASWRDIVN
jgi:hypothetical protein